MQAQPGRPRLSPGGPVPVAAGDDDGAGGPPGRPEPPGAVGDPAARGGQGAGRVVRVVQHQQPRLVQILQQVPHDVRQAAQPQVVGRRAQLDGEGEHARGDRGGVLRRYPPGGDPGVGGALDGAQRHRALAAPAEPVQDVDARVVVGVPGLRDDRGQCVEQPVPAAYSRSAAEPVERWAGRYGHRRDARGGVQRGAVGGRCGGGVRAPGAVSDPPVRLPPVLQDGRIGDPGGPQDAVQQVRRLERGKVRTGEVAAEGAHRDAHCLGDLPHAQAGVLPCEGQLPAEVLPGGDALRVRMREFAGPGSVGHECLQESRWARLRQTALRPVRCVRTPPTRTDSSGSSCASHGRPG